MNTTGKMLIIGLIGLIVVLQSGCAAIPAAALSSVTSAGQVGISAYKTGKLDAVEMVTMADMCWAVDQAVAELSMEVVRTDADEYGRIYNVWTRDANGDRIAFYVLRKSETMTRVRIAVGVFGSEATSRLVLRRINTALVERGALSLSPDG